MELLNATAGRAGWALGADETGREHVVVVVNSMPRCPISKPAFARRRM